MEVCCRVIQGVPYVDTSKSTLLSSNTNLSPSQSTLRVLTQCNLVSEDVTSTYVSLKAFLLMILKDVELKSLSSQDREVYARILAEICNVYYDYIMERSTTSHVTDHITVDMGTGNLRSEFDGTRSLLVNRQDKGQQQKQHKGIQSGAPVLRSQNCKENKIMSDAAESNDNEEIITIKQEACSEEDDDNDNGAIEKDTQSHDSSSVTSLEHRVCHASPRNSSGAHLKSSQLNKSSSQKELSLMGITGIYSQIPSVVQQGLMSPTSDKHNVISPTSDQHTSSPVSTVHYSGISPPGIQGSLVTSPYDGKQNVVVSSPGIQGSLVTSPYDGQQNVVASSPGVQRSLTSSNRPIQEVEVYTSPTMNVVPHRSPQGQASLKLTRLIELQNRNVKNKCHQYVCGVCNHAVSSHDEYVQHSVQQHPGLFSVGDVAGQLSWHRPNTSPSFSTAQMQQKQHQQQQQQQQQQNQQKQPMQEEIQQQPHMLKQKISSTIQNIKAKFKVTGGTSTPKSSGGLNLGVISQPRVSSFANSIARSVKKHNCPICGKYFCTTSGLVTHIRTHTGEKPFVCSYCNKRFNDRCNVKRHERIHTGDTNTTCLVCKKKLRTLKELRQHMAMNHPTTSLPPTTDTHGTSAMKSTVPINLKPDSVS